MNSKKQTITPLYFETYLAVIKNSLTSRLFRNFYALVNGKKKDLTKNGDLSCAFFVSFILFHFHQIKAGHVTVESTVADLKKGGWKEIKKPQIGCVIVWKQKAFSHGHKHIGFYVGNDKAVSNSHKLGHPIKYHWTFGNQRNIEVILWNPKFK